MPAFGLPPFNLEGVNLGIGPDAPGLLDLRCRPGAVPANRVGTDLTEAPALAAGHAFVELVPVAEPCIEQHRPTASRIEPEALNNPGAALFEHRALTPGFSSIGRDQKER